MPRSLFPLIALALGALAAGACARTQADGTPTRPGAEDGPAATAELRGAEYGPGSMHGHGPMHGPGGAATMPMHGPAAACPYDSTRLSAQAREAVERALADERRAETMYVALDAKLGATSPFSRIIHAERRHAMALEALLAAHGLPIPGSGTVTPPAVTDPREACKVGVASERANIALYDELLATPLPADVRCVLEHLRDASRARHQPAFERCAAGP